MNMIAALLRSFVEFNASVKHQISCCYTPAMGGQLYVARRCIFIDVGVVPRLLGLRSRQTNVAKLLIRHKQRFAFDVNSVQVSFFRDFFILVLNLAMTLGGYTCWLFNVAGLFTHP